MRDRFFREDENELPYLLWEKRDDEAKRPYTETAKSREEQIDSILDGLYIELVNRSALKQKLLSFLNSKDCTGLRAEEGLGGCDFIITRQNRYVKTTDEFEYIPEFAEFKRIFRECYSSHSHEGLLKDSRFQEMIKKTGMEFIGCGGGYVCRYSSADDEFTLQDEIDVTVSFRVGSITRLYHLDLDRMELSERYFEYDF
jgi:hypothetical protein